jgi:hypothetical protein
LPFFIFGYILLVHFLSTSVFHSEAVEKLTELLK